MLLILARVITAFLGLGAIILLFDAMTFGPETYGTPWQSSECLGWNYKTPEIYLVSLIINFVILFTLALASLPMAKRISLSTVGIFIATLALFGIIGQSEVDRDLILYFASQMKLDYPR